MNIEDLTIGQAKQLAAMFGQTGLNAMIGKKCIVRTYATGVWFGEIAEKSGSEVIVKNARLIWQTLSDESISLSAVAIHGIKHDKKNCEAVESVWLEAIEIIPCSTKSVSSIEAAEILKNYATSYTFTDSGY